MYDKCYLEQGNDEGECERERESRKARKQRNKKWQEHDLIMINAYARIN